MAIDILVQIYTLKGLAVPTLRNTAGAAYSLTPDPYLASLLILSLKPFGTSTKTRSPDFSPSAT
jgi:hypothetical protein